MSRRLSFPLSPVSLSLLLACLAPPVLAENPAATQQQTLAFDVPAGPLENSLTAIARQSARGILFDPALVRGEQAEALHGDFTVEQAIERLLQGRNLRLRVTESGALNIEALPGSGSALELSSLLVSDSWQEDARGPAYGLVASRSTTATKTDTALRETPQAISVITREEMQTRRHDSLADTLQYTSGVVTQPNGYSRVADDYRLRGFDIGPRTGGVLRDGLKLQSSQFEGGQEPYGLERVEVLKGASSVLYGQLSPGGLVNTVSKRPSDDPLHEINVEYGNYQRRQISTDHGGPLDESGRFTYRLTALWRDSETQYTSIDDDRRFFAPALTWHIDDDTRLTLLATYQETRTTLTPAMNYNVTKYSATPGRKIPYDLFAGEPSFDDYSGDMGTLGYLFEHRLDDGLELRHALRYFHSESDYDYISLNGSRVTGADRSTLTRSYNSREDIATGWASDSSLQWSFDSGRWEHTLLAGLDYYYKTYDSHRWSGNAPSLDLANPTYGNLPTVNTSIDRGSDLHSRQAGFYLQEQAKFAERWVFVLGLRQDWARSHTHNYRDRSRSTKSDQELSGRIGMVYLADNGLAPYISYSQSFLPTDGVDSEGRSFEPTEGEQYEIGLRYQPPGRDLMLSAAVYRLTQENVVSSIPGSDFDEQTGKERSKGLELELKAGLTPQLNLSASYAYTDAHIIADNDPVLEGSRIEGIPYHSASLWLDYRLARLGLPNLKIGAGARYNGTTRTSASVSDRNIPAYTLVDALLSYDLDAHWQMTAKVQNLTNKRYLYCANACRYGDERTAIGTLSYRW
ncbi:TonB-dependent siderophore receptor [Azotobacter chroococcum]|uniref:TonB-dependent siderophore receptor n=1 Tax=Azotobacter chroococcum TaxID=353 RepID=UPI000B5F783B|nr:TonB-dependent siderophore receptor [Azotobacter chroococcum]ASL26317.1 TonB-dependent receptor [Azotobacter chroococcum]